MKKHLLILLLFIVYYLVFWKHAVGINLFLFQIAMYSLMVFLDRSSIRSKYFLLTLFGALCGGFFMMMYNSTTAIVLAISAHVLLLAFYFQPKLKTISYSLPSGLFQFLSSLKSMAEVPNVLPQKDALYSVGKRAIKILVLPLLTILFFYIIYRVANPAFNKWMFDINTEIGVYISRIFKDFTPVWLLFILMGLMIVFSSLFKGKSNYFLDIEGSKKTSLVNVYENGPVKRLLVKLTAKEEFYAAAFVLIVVNLLLLTVNYFDLNSIWLHPQASIAGKRSMRMMVHSGSTALIISILVAMAMLLYIFKDRQNFIRHHKVTKVLAYIWMAQNSFLVISVLLRNYYYIQQYGYAYKRVGVYIFLILTLLGIATLIYKISQNKTMFYLLKWNSLFAYIMFIAMCFVDWDMFIVKQNLTNKHMENMDRRFTFSLSDKTLPLFQEHPKFLNFSKDLYIWNADNNYKNEKTKYYYENRIENFKNRKAKESWLSWNFAEARALKKLKQFQQSKPSAKQSEIQPNIETPFNFIDVFTYHPQLKMD